MSRDSLEEVSRSAEPLTGLERAAGRVGLTNRCPLGKVNKGEQGLIPWGTRLACPLARSVPGSGRDRVCHIDRAQ